jgi:NAD(P)-dependent dehydrogenase (short-subunit alcohol dehydrogenase family)
VEEMLEVHRREHPELEQLVFRVCTVLGARTSNQITALFERPVVLDVAGGTAPFCFVWDEDLVDLLVRGVLEGRSGVYNVSGDGTLSMGEIARVLGKPHVAVSERALALALGVLSRLGLSPYGPEQTLFLKHRPVLANDRLASDFGAAPRHSTEAAFRRFAESRGLVRPAARALAGHTGVVSGAAGGIGRALAWRFGRGGARVALLDLDGAGVAAEARALARAGYSSLGLACDVTDPDACAKAIAEVSERLGGVDVLVANAGVSHRSLFLETELPVYRRVMDVNFFGALHLVKAAQEALLRTRGRIVAISSVAGFAPLLGRSGYCASKHALQGFFGTLRAELASRGVGVLVVCPGVTATGIERHALDGRGAPALRPQSRVGRQARPEDVADAVYHALRRGRRELVLTPVGRVSRGLMRLSPRLYERLMTRSLRVELARPPDAGRAP